VNKIYSSFLLLVGILVLSASSLKAQITTSQLTGKIVNAKGEALPGVTVLAVNNGTGNKYGATTNAEGRYLINNMNPGGPYTITVTYIGYRKEERPEVTLSLGSSTFNFLMSDESKALSEVVVKGNNTGRTGGFKIGANQLKTLPSLSRSLQDFTRATPQSNNNSFLGTNFRYNNVTLDGAINNDAIGFSPSLGGQTNASGQMGSSTRTNPVSIDAVQDIQVLIAPYDVKIGNFLGGSINAVTRSGSNEVHGSVYGFGRNASLIGKNNAGDGSKEPSSFHEYQTGFRVGFPIIKDKLFFFTNEEITRRQDPVILAAGSPDMPLITAAQAQRIVDHMNALGTAAGKTDAYNPGTYGNSSIYSNSTKFFNRLDWNINEKHSLSLRNNTITSEATNLERDQQNFRFSGIDYKQNNNQTSTVAELKSHFNSAVSNSLILGYSNVHDYRDPTSDPSLPQIQIKSGPGTIFLGTDREAAIFNMKQKTFEVTDNVNIIKGKNNITIGTHNEFYNITYGFVNSWNGRVDYDSIGAFVNDQPSRVRGNFNYTDNSRDYIMAHPPAQFKVGLYSIYGQDEIQVTDRFKLTAGIRLDYTNLPNKQPLSTKTTGAPVDPNYGTTYTYTKPKDIKNKYFDNVQFSPRISFSYDFKGDQSLVLRGGSGLFTGRIPFAWLGYAFYNNGVTYGAYDTKFKYPTPAPVPGSNPVVVNPQGEAQFAAAQGVDVHNAAGATQVDMIDNNFKMPQMWRSNLALDYSTPDMWRFTVEGIYTKTLYDLQFKQVNYVDNPTYNIYDTKHQQPIFSGAKINPLFTNAYQLSNTKQGYRYGITGQINKGFDFGLNASAAYTYGQSKDITNGIRNSMESNWQLNQALNPNNPKLAYSNFDIRHRIVATVNYRQDWGTKGKWMSNFSFFFSAASGVPFSYGFVNSTIDGTGQQVSLVYIPKDQTEARQFFTAANQQMADNFWAYIQNDKYLKTRVGEFTERNGGRTPWNNQLDFRFTQDLNLKVGKTTHTLTFTYDIVNLTNLLNKNWGIQYFSPNTFNSMASVGLTQVTAGSPTAYNVYTWANPGVPYSKDFFASRHQMQLGLRYSF
jgi:hypothetical protein